MTLKAWPACICVTETTPSSNGLRRRETRLWRAVTTCAAINTGSIAWCGAAACPPEGHSRDGSRTPRPPWGRPGPRPESSPRHRSRSPRPAGTRASRSPGETPRAAGAPPRARSRRARRGRRRASGPRAASGRGRRSLLRPGARPCRRGSARSGTCHLTRRPAGRPRPSCRRRSAPYSRAVGAAPPPTRWCAAPRTPARGAGAGRGGWRSDPSGRWGGACSYAGTRTQPVYYTNLAFRPPRDAHATPMPDQRVREPGPLVARHECHQVPLDLHRVILFREGEQGRNSLDVRVDHDAFVLPEPGAEDDVRGFAAHTGEPDQLLHGVGYRASMALDQRLRHPDDGFGLVAEEPRAVDLLLQDLRVGAGIVLSRAILREQRRGNHVDSRIGRLGRENRGDQQLECALVL